MSAIEKEKIFVELRKYHSEQFPDKLANEDMNRLRTEFAEIEDEIVAMILNMVNGKFAFLDFSAQLGTFKNKVKIVPAGNRAEDGNRNFFLSKIDQLLQILDLAQATTFKLKVPRVARVS